MYSFQGSTHKAELRGRTEYGEPVSVRLSSKDAPGVYDLTLTFEGRDPQQYGFLAKDVEFLGNKVQFKGPFLRVVLNDSTAKKFRNYLAPEY